MSDINDPNGFTTNVVEVHNIGTTLFRQDYENKWYQIPAGRKQFVTWEMAVEWFGDPRLTDAGPGNRHRSDEFNRLRGRYGAFDYLGPDWVKQLPNVEIHDVQGNEVFMIIQDPDNTRSNSSALTKTEATTNDDFLRQQVARLEQQLATITSHLNREALGIETEAPSLSVVDAGPGITPPPPEAPTDDSTPAPEQAPGQTAPAPAPAPAPPFAPKQFAGLGAQKITTPDPALVAQLASQGDPGAPDAEPIPEVKSVVDAPTRTPATA